MSEQVKLPPGPELSSELHEIVGKLLARSEFSAADIATLRRVAAVLDDLPALIAQRDAEWRSGLLGDEAVEAAARSALDRTQIKEHEAWDDLSPEFRQAMKDEASEDLQAAIDKGAPGGGGDE